MFCVIFRRKKVPKDFNVDTHRVKAMDMGMGQRSWPLLETCICIFGTYMQKPGRQARV